VPFYVAAPTTTIDLKCESGRNIPIEERGEDEVLYATGIDESGTARSVRIAPNGAHALNPAFDVTPKKYITGIITENGIIKPSKSEIKRVTQ